MLDFWLVSRKLFLNGARRYAVDTGCDVCLPQPCTAGRKAKLDTMIGLQRDH
jgi:hypothetical protein